MTQSRYTNSVHLKLTHSDTRSHYSIARTSYSWNIKRAGGVENGLYRPNIVSSTIQYYTIAEFNVVSKAECDQHMKLKKPMPT